jgi:signal transduction histidine kinase
MALLYGALVLLVGAALLLTSYLLLDRALAASPLTRIPGKATITYPDGQMFEMDPAGVQEAIRQDALQYLVSNGLLYFGVIVLIGSIGGYMLARQALRPIARITKTARDLSLNNLNERIGLGGPEDELRELADTFDAMLVRLDAAFNSQKRFVANASHEMRTPLAVIQTELDVTLSDPRATIDDLRQMAEVVRDATNRAQRLVDALLALARLQARAGQQLEVRENVELRELIPNAVAAATAEATGRGIKITADGTAAPTIGDPRLLERVIGNLVENAVRYNVPGGTVHIHTGYLNGDRPPEARLEVVNTGTLVKPDEVANLFEPFRRGSVARTGARGAGLGLSIVQAIIDAHHGKIEASAQPDGGLRVIITLPSQPDLPAEPESSGRAKHNGHASEGRLAGSRPNA